MSRPFDELKAISNAWGTLTREREPSQNDLAIATYHTMVDASATRGVWENLDPEARAFVGWLLNQRNMLSLVDDLPAHMDRPPEEVTPLLERVRRLGIVDVDEVMVRGTRVVSSGDNLYSWAAKSQSEAQRRRVVSISTEAGKVLRDVIEESKRPAPFEESFAALLESLEQEQVQRIAATWRLPDVARYYKSELIGVMSEFLATGQGMQLLLSPLPEASQRLFTYLGANGSRATAASARKEIGWDEREFRAALLPLVQRALVWDVLVGERRYIFVPRDLASGVEKSAISILPSMQPKLETSAPYSTDSKLPYEMAWDLLTLLAFSARQDLSLTLQDSRITKRAAKKLNESFIHPTDLKGGTDYIDMVVHLAQSLGLMTEKHDEQASLVLTPRADEWAKLSFEAQSRRIFGLWQEDRKWTEPATYGTVYWWNSDLTGARKRLIKHLLDLPAMQWTSLDGFLRKIHLTEPFLIWPQDELVRRFGLRALQGFRSHWFEIEGRIIADMLRTVLNWLGAVDLGRDKQKRFISFRVNEEGRKLFDPDHGEAAGTGKARHHNQKTLLVQPNYEVLVLQPDSTVLWNLLRMAELVRHDRVSVYVLTKESVLAAVEAGLSPESIHTFLESNTGKGLPQNVAHAISDWARLIRRATIRRATLIEVDDAQVLDEMMASRKTRRYVLQRLSPTVAVANLPATAESARDDPWQKLLKELRAAGYVPSYKEEAAQTGEHISAGVANNDATSAENGKSSLLKGNGHATRTTRATRRTREDREAPSANLHPSGKTGTR